MLALIVLAAAGCQRNDRENEARLFLERYDAVGRAGEADRPQRVERLEELPILDDEVRRVRDRCVVVQRAVLRAQARTDEARARVEVLEDAGAVTRAQTREVERLLAEATAAKDTADRGMSACLDGVSRLRAHHGRRR